MSIAPNPNLNLGQQYIQPPQPLSLEQSRSLLQTQGVVGDPRAGPAIGAKNLNDSPLDPIIGAVTGQNAADAVREGAAAQAQAINLSMEENAANSAQVRADNAPFNFLGLANIPELQGVSGNVPGAPQLNNVNQAGAAFGNAVNTGQTGHNLNTQAQYGNAFNTLHGFGLEQQALGTASGLSADSLNDPSFQAQRDQLNRNILQHQAARGKKGAGETGTQIARQNLLLGEQFARRDLDNQLSVQDARFDELGSALDFASQGQGQGFNQTRAAGALDTQGQNTQFDQIAQAVQGMNDIEIQQFKNDLALQGIDFDQLQGLVNVGQSAAAGQAVGDINFNTQASNLISEQANVAASSAIGQAQAGARGQENIVNTALGVYSLFNPPEQRRQESTTSGFLR